MAANTKYTQAPTQDPDEAEHGVFSQPPPAYQAEASSAQDEARLFGGGAPRASQDGDDDIPDDFKVCPSTNRPTEDSVPREFPSSQPVM